MKKLLIIVLCLTCISCSKDIESVATDHMTAMMKEYVNKPEEASLANARTVYKSDSLCIIDFTLKAPNGYGNMVSEPMEYIYVDINYMGHRVRGESLTQIGGSLVDKLLEEYLGGEKRELSETEKSLEKMGFDVDYVLENTVANVKSKYRDELIKWAHHSSKHPKIEDKLTFSAAWMKLLLRGRIVDDEKGKDIKL